MLQNILKKEIQAAVKNLFGKGVDFSVEAGGQFGDYTSNAAMVLRAGNPRQTAEKIIAELQRSAAFAKLFSKTETAGPGFINFRLSERALAEGLKSLAKKPKKKSGKIQIEFISANPTGKLHIGHGRGAFYGDALANVLRRAGYKVEKEYFINDSMESTQIKELGKTAMGEGESYLTDYLRSKMKARAAKLKKIKIASEAGYLLAGDIQQDNKKFIERDLGIKFNKWFSEEQTLRAKKAFQKTIALFKESDLIYERDGAWWLKTSKFGDDEDRVVVRSDGSYSYFLSDVAYHTNKFGRKYGKVIDIWGADHQGHIKRMHAAKKMLGWPGELEVLISQLVTIKEGAVRKKLSKRKGTVILLADLMREVGSDALRWFYLEKSLNTHMEFDPELAKKRSKDNPVYYVEYAHARIASILKKAKKRRLKPASSYQYEFPAEIALVKKLIQFPEVIDDISADYQVHRLTAYAYELAHTLTMFYRDIRVLGSGEEEPARLALVAETKKALAETLGLLGISAPDKM